MPEILTTEFKTDTTRKVVVDALASDYFVFVSAIENITPENSIKSQNEFLAKTLFGKIVNNIDTKYMIKYYPWQAGETYVQYDDSVDLEGEKFYAVVGPTNNDTGDYRVYKCLFNNFESPTIAPPVWDTNQPDQTYGTGDGYVWKFMYSLSLIEFEAYNALGYIPITGTFDADPVPTSGGSQINIIQVENPDANFGYSKKTGTLSQTPDLDGTVNTREDPTLALGEDYYAGQSIYFVKSNGSFELYEIDTYDFDTQTNRASIRVKDNIDLITYPGGRAANPTAPGLPAQDGVGVNNAFSIFPRVLIEGDGTGARAIPNVDSEGRIRTITILSAGDGYNTVQASVVDPLYDFDPSVTNSTDVRATVRPILSPTDGHGTDLVDELKCHHYLLYGYILSDDNESIGDTNTYTGVGIVKDPDFTGVTPSVFDNRIAVNSPDYNKVTVNSIITQVNQQNETTFSGIVHEIDSANEIIYIAEYNNIYPNQVGQDTAFDLTKDLFNETGQIVVINTPIVDNVTFSEYVQRTGKVYYMEDFFPLARNELSREEFKIVFEF